MSAPENPAAFPCTGEGLQNPRYTQHGMSLRDWFAGKALAGLAWRYDENTHYDDVALDAFKLADAMLAAREVPA